MMLLITFHTFLVPTTLAALTVVARKRSIRSAAVGLAVIGAVSFIVGRLLPVAFGVGQFAFLLFMALTVFVYVPVYLVVNAVLLDRRRQRGTAVAAVAAALVLAAVGVDAFFVEPFRLEVSRHQIRSPRLDREIRVAVLADFQTDQFGAYERRVLDTVLAQDADLILLAGDYVQIHDPERRAEVWRQIRAYLDDIDFDAPLGVFAVQGDVEHGDWYKAFRGTGIRAVRGTRTFRLPGLTLTGLTRADSRQPELRIARDAAYHVALGHAPDFALADVGADLLVAGHTHGGQVRLPFIGPLLTFSRVPRAWAAGVNDIGGGRTLVVSRGTGMERNWAPRLRFLCRPEVVVLDLGPA